MSIFDEAARLERENSPFALAHIIESHGSTPRHSGQMIVRSDGNIIGTIGGGMIERVVIAEAVDAIDERKARVVQGRMARSGEDAVGSDCGGTMRVFIDVHGLRPRLILLGAGHVNRAVAKAAAPLGFAIFVADTFAGSLDPDHFPPGTKLVEKESFSAACESIRLQADDFVLIATNSQDKEALDYCIGKPLRYLGLLASRRKILVFTQALRDQGVAEEELRRLNAPVGLDLGAETPEEIAISILAEVLMVKRQTSGGRMRDTLYPRRGKLAVIRGAGDIATGIAIRLFQSGFRVLMLDVAKPTAIRRSVAFAQAAFDGQTSVEGVVARLAPDVRTAMGAISRGEIPLLVDPEAAFLDEIKPRFLIDAILAKINLGTRKDMAPITIALGPGFTAGVDCDAVIETNRGHYLGRVIEDGPAQANTGIPGEVAGHSDRRVVRAPCSGVLHCQVALGDLVLEGQLLGQVGETPVLAPLGGMVRGLLHDGLSVTEGFKIGDIDPRGAKADYLSISDKARAVAGGVLEAMLSLDRKRPL